MSDPILPKNYLFVDENGNHVELTMTYQELKGKEVSVNTYGGVFKVDGNKATAILDHVD